MEQVFHLRSEWIAASLATIIFELMFPVALAFLVRRRFGIGWRYFLYGALIFFLFQLVTRLPAIEVIQASIQPQLHPSRTLLFIWLVILSFTAGLFEEGGRYIGYRWLMGREEKTWSKAVMYGLGHGGLESMLLVAGLSLLTLINLIVLSSMDLQQVPPAQRAIITQQLTALGALPVWAPLVGAYERLWTVPIQVALSVIVLQVFRRGSLNWLWLAILGHTLVNVIAAGVVPMVSPQGIPSLLLPEAAVTLFGMTALWVIWRLRDDASKRPPYVQATIPLAES